MKTTMNERAVMVNVSNALHQQAQMLNKAR
jgi:hypothetical protein